MATRPDAVMLARKIREYCLIVVKKLTAVLAAKQFAATVGFEADISIE